MRIDDLIAGVRSQINGRLDERNKVAADLAALRDAETTDQVAVDALRAKKDEIDADIDVQRARLQDLETEKQRDDAADRLARDIQPAAVRPAYDSVARTGAEERTYAPHKERGFDQNTGQFRQGAKPGAQFERDVAAAFLFNDPDARERLARHMSEERVERAQWLERAAGTGAFAGLTVPQYLTDLYAPAVAARRPFADACTHHDLPEAGMTVNLSRITTSTNTGLQASENTAVTNQDIDDTLLTINVQTNAGQQTLSRQAIERGTGVEPVVLNDLYRRYATVLDSTLINQATTGLAASSTGIAYTDATPTVAELYPKFFQALAAVEAAMLDMASGDNLIVMHSRRWYWLQNALASTWPIMSQPGVAAQMWGGNAGVAYNQGARGVLPNGSPVIVDNNVSTACLGTATTGGTQDQIYVVDQNECHLWEDPSAPVFIRAEQPSAASLGVLLVLYGYFAYTFSRYTQAQVIYDTGLVPPTFVGS